MCAYGLASAIELLLKASPLRLLQTVSARADAHRTHTEHSIHTTHNTQNTIHNTQHNTRIRSTTAPDTCESCALRRAASSSACWRRSRSASSVLRFSSRSTANFDSASSWRWRSCSASISRLRRSASARNLLVGEAAEGDAMAAFFSSSWWSAFQVTPALALGLSVCAGLVAAPPPKLDRCQQQAMSAKFKT